MGRVNGKEEVKRPEHCELPASRATRTTHMQTHKRTVSEDAWHGRDESICGLLLAVFALVRFLPVTQRSGGSGSSFQNQHQQTHAHTDRHRRTQTQTHTDTHTCTHTHAHKTRQTDLLCQRPSKYSARRWWKRISSLEAGVFISTERQSASLPRISSFSCVSTITRVPIH